MSTQNRASNKKLLVLLAIVAVAVVIIAVIVVMQYAEDQADREAQRKIAAKIKAQEYCSSVSNLQDFFKDLGGAMDSNVTVNQMTQEQFDGCVANFTNYYINEGISE